MALKSYLTHLPKQLSYPRDYVDCTLCGISVIFSERFSCTGKRKHKTHVFSFDNVCTSPKSDTEEEDDSGCCWSRVGEIIYKAGLSFCIEKVIFGVPEGGHSNRLPVLIFSSIKGLENASLTYHELRRGLCYIVRKRQVESSLLPQ